METPECLHRRDLEEPCWLEGRASGQVLKLLAQQAQDFCFYVFTWRGFGGTDREAVEMIKPFRSLSGAMVIHKLLEKCSKRQPK